MRRERNQLFIVRSVNSFGTLRGSETIGRQTQKAFSRWNDGNANNGNELIIFEAGRGARVPLEAHVFSGKKEKNENETAAHFFEVEGRIKNARLPN